MFKLPRVRLANVTSKVTCPGPVGCLKVNSRCSYGQIGTRVWSGGADDREVAGNAGRSGPPRCTSCRSFSFTCKAQIRPVIPGSSRVAFFDFIFASPKSSWRSKTGRGAFRERTVLNERPLCVVPNGRRVWHSRCGHPRPLQDRRAPPCPKRLVH